MSNPIPKVTKHLSSEHLNIFRIQAELRAEVIYQMKLLLKQFPKEYSTLRYHVFRTKDVPKKDKSDLLDFCWIDRIHYDVLFTDMYIRFIVLYNDNKTIRIKLKSFNKKPSCEFLLHVEDFSTEELIKILDYLAYNLLKEQESIETTPRVLVPTIVTEQFGPQQFNITQHELPFDNDDKSE